MEAVHLRPPEKTKKKILATRQGAWIIAAITAVLGGLTLLLFLDRYKDSVSADLASKPVLTADRLIPKGTAGSVVITEKMFRPGAVAQEDVRPGALTDADALLGKAAAREILPGQQISASDFSSVADPVRSRLTKDERLVQVPITGSYGLIGTVRRGDRVDVMASFGSGGQSGAVRTRPTVRYVMRDVRIAGAPTTGGSSVLLEVTDKQAAELAWVSDNAKMWFALRPPVGSTDGKVGTVSGEKLQVAKPIEVTAQVRRTPDGGTVTIRAGEGE